MLYENLYDRNCDGHTGHACPIEPGWKLIRCISMPVLSFLMDMYLCTIMYLIKSLISLKLHLGFFKGY